VREGGRLGNRENIREEIGKILEMKKGKILERK
jgi:hypothetical protein